MVLKYGVLLKFHKLGVLEHVIVKLPTYGALRSALWDTKYVRLDISCDTSLYLSVVYLHLDPGIVGCWFLYQDHYNEHGRKETFLNKDK